MKNDEFYKMFQEMQKEETDTMVTKGREYCEGSDDKLNNFKSIAKGLNISPLIVWQVYFMKHISSITNFIKDGEVHSEPIEGRIKDARNYLALLRGLIKEGK